MLQEKNQTEVEWGKVFLFSQKTTKNIINLKIILQGQNTDSQNCSYVMANKLESVEIVLFILLQFYL